MINIVFFYPFVDRMVNIFIYGESELLITALFFGVRGIVFLINEDHFCLFQDTIFELNSGSPVRMVDNQGLTQTENELLFAQKSATIFFALFRAKKHEA